jgi:hypothetical protein
MTIILYYPQENATNEKGMNRLAHRPISKTAKRLHHPSLPHSIKIFILQSNKNV